MCCYMLSYATMLCNLCPYILKYVILCGLSKYGMCQVYFNGFESDQDNILPQLGIEAIISRTHSIMLPGQL